MCGQYRTEGPHDFEVDDPEDYHPFEKSINEVALMYERLKGLVVIKHKKDCLELPDKQYRKIVCKPTPSVLRVAQALMSSSMNAVTGLTLLRELSDGFQYREVADGITACTTCDRGEGRGIWTQINSRGFPAMTVPAGFTTHVYDRGADGQLLPPKPASLPVGIDLLGLPFGEPTLFSIASAYEAGTRHRIQPPDFGPLK